jgi:hypothetical protein
MPLGTRDLQSWASGELRGHAVCGNKFAPGGKNGPQSGQGTGLLTQRAPQPLVPERTATLGRIAPGIHPESGTPSSPTSVHLSHVGRAACPGYVATDFTGFNAPRTPAEEAAIAIRLATLPDDRPHGGFFDDESRVPW